MVQSSFVVINENGGRNMHGIYEAKPLFDAAFFQASRYFFCNVHELQALGNLIGKLFAKGFHAMEFMLEEAHEAISLG